MTHARSGVPAPTATAADACRGYRTRRPRRLGTAEVFRAQCCAATAAAVQESDDPKPYASVTPVAALETVSRLYDAALRVIYGTEAHALCSARD